MTKKPLTVDDIVREVSGHSCPAGLGKCMQCVLSERFAIALTRYAESLMEQIESRKGKYCTKEACPSCDIDVSHNAALDSAKAIIAATNQKTL